MVAEFPPFGTGDSFARRYVSSGSFSGAGPPEVDGELINATSESES